MRTIATPFLVMKLNFMRDPLFPRLKKLVIITATFRDTRVWSKVCEEVFSNQGQFRASSESPPCLSLSHFLGQYFKALATLKGTIFICSWGIRENALFHCVFRLAWVF